MNSSLKYLIIILISIAIILIMWNPFASKVKFKDIEIEGVKLKAEVAESATERMKGLMFKNNLSENECMLFIFPKEGRHSMWMMNMKFPIDIIWADSKGKIVDIVMNAQPCTLNCPNYRPKEDAKYVIETIANFTLKNYIKIGSMVKMD